MLLVEHDIDRVFRIADAVTVMNDGEVLVDGTVEDARASPEVQAVYIGAGAHALADYGRATPRRRGKPCCSSRGVDTFYGKSHILRDVIFDVQRTRDRRPARAQRRRQVDGAENHRRHRAAAQRRNRSPRRARRSRDNRRPQITRHGISYVPQGRGLFAGMSVAENMELGRLRRRNGAACTGTRSGSSSSSRASGERWRSPADYLSGGEQQMVAVARALAGDTQVLLLDEPFEGLAPAVVEELFEAFDKLRREISIVIVDHHLDLALALSDRTVALERGAVTHVGPSRALERQSRLCDAGSSGCDQRFAR